MSIISVMLSNHSQPLGIYQYREIYPTLLIEGHVSFREIGVIIGTRNDYVHNFSNAEQSLPASYVLLPKLPQRSRKYKSKKNYSVLAPLPKAFLNINVLVSTYT